MIERIAENGIVGEIWQDEDPINPREYDHIGTMFCWHNRYMLGDKQPTIEPDEVLEDFPADKYIVLPLYLYDHSGITISTSPFSCPWDSGQVGFILAAKGIDGLTDEQIKKCLQAEVEEYDQYLTGEVYGYVIREEDGDIIDSCWGIYDFKYCREEVLNRIKSLKGVK